MEKKNDVSLDFDLDTSIFVYLCTSYTYMAYVTPNK